MIKSITDYLDITAEKFPDKPAFVDENGALTFKQLKNDAMAIASFLISEGIRREPIAIFMPKSKECIAAFMGSAYSGNFYCPIDTAMPTERINKILIKLQPKMVITVAECADKIAEWDYDGKYVIYDEAVKTEISESAVTSVMDKQIDMDLLYVLFTSGSTGIPKGVAITHQSVIDYAKWVTETFHITSEDRFANQSPFYFDKTIFEIYATIKEGATMYIIPQLFLSFPIKLMQYLEENEITTIFWVPSVMCAVVNLKAFTKLVPSKLTKIFFSGEPMPTKQLNVWRKYLPNATYTNLYGPTEITDVCTYYTLNREFGDDEPLPIGWSCRNTEILVLNEENQLVKGDETGELCIRGRALAMGYYNDPERSDMGFVQNPLNKAFRDLIYRSGDIVRYNRYGEIEYLGRKDFQIKHRGYRIDLGEIETASGMIENIERCACVYDEKKSEIVMFYVGNVTGEEIAKILESKIPQYMIPKRYVKKLALPLNGNGKINRLELKQELV